MNSQIHNVPELVSHNYLQWKRKMIDVLRSRNLWRLVDGKQTKPTDADELVIWEERSFAQYLCVNYFLSKSNLGSL